jgi:uncharacterized membrane protein YgcG
MGASPFLSGNFSNPGPVVKFNIETLLQNHTTRPGGCMTFLKISRAALCGLVLTLSLALPGWARPASPVQDEAKVLSEATQTKIRQIDEEIYRATGKDLLVVTESALSSGTTQAEAEKIFSRERLNGVLILLVPSQKHLGIVPGRASEVLFPRSHLSDIRQRMLEPLRKGDYDNAVLEGAEDVRATFSGAASSRSSSVSTYHRSSYPAPMAQREHSWGLLSILFWVGGIFLVLMVLRAVFSAMSGSSAPYGGSYGAPMAMGGGGGSFLGNMAAGIGGAFLGNALYNSLFGHNQGSYYDYPAGGGYDSGVSSPTWTGDDGGIAGAGDYSDFGGGSDFGGSSGGDWT